MNRKWMVVFAGLLLAAQIASAQFPVKIEIPYAFTVGNTEYPAGTWIVSQSATNAHIQTFARQGGKEKFLAVSHPLSELNQQDPSRAVFNRYGGQYFLSEVWRSGATGVRFSMGKPERKLVAEQKEGEKLSVIAGTP